MQKKIRKIRRKKRKRRKRERKKKEKCSFRVRKKERSTRKKVLSGVVYVLCTISLGFYFFFMLVFFFLLILRQERKKAHRSGKLQEKKVGTKEKGRYMAEKRQVYTQNLTKKFAPLKKQKKSARIRGIFDRKQIERAAARYGPEQKKNQKKQPSNQSLSHKRESE